MCNQTQLCYSQSNILFMYFQHQFTMTNSTAGNSYCSRIFSLLLMIMPPEPVWLKITNRMKRDISHCPHPQIFKHHNVKQMYDQIRSCWKREYFLIMPSPFRNSVTHSMQVCASLLIKLFFVLFYHSQTCLYTAKLGLWLFFKCLMASFLVLKLIMQDNLHPEALQTFKYSLFLRGGGFHDCFETWIYLFLWWIAFKDFCPSWSLAGKK